MTQIVKLESTNEALSILQSLRNKGKQDNQHSIYARIKQIYCIFLDWEAKVRDRSPKVLSKADQDTVRSENYLFQCKDSYYRIQDMLEFVLQKTKSVLNGTNTRVLDGTNTSQLNTARSQASSIGAQSCENPEQHQKQTKTAKDIQDRDQSIQKLKNQLKQNHHKSKTMQIKLLNNLKRLDMQLKQKQCQLNQVKSLLIEKLEEIEDLNALNNKRMKKIREFQENMYVLELELQQREFQLEAERQCSVILQNKVTKMHHIVYEKDCSQKQPEQQENYEQIIQEQSEMFSQQSSILTESKENKYLESIQRLTAQLGQAYEKINQLTRAQKTQRGRPMSKSGYFGNFFKF